MEDSAHGLRAVAHVIVVSRCHVNTQCFPLVRCSPRGDLSLDASLKPDVGFRGMGNGTRDNERLRRLYQMRKIKQIAGVLSLACAFTAAAQAAATETVLHNFPISPGGALPIRVWSAMRKVTFMGRPLTAAQRTPESCTCWIRPAIRPCCTASRAEPTGNIPGRDSRRGWQSLRHHFLRRHGRSGSRLHAGSGRP